ncbi:hypothetical protein JCM19239_5561 [Vibrio variabilis]|uniref:Uncharacterized protein n=1 Tax=Vibrio variabilis TaxID=990271 RepID=A0ABQ0JEL7_9VIBR|nr:hypothetical protein JCM19239_5561 [Vibrio variabilis]
MPFGLHHTLTIPMNYTELGGTYELLTGTNAAQVFMVKTHYGLLG